jgi:CBS domain-containing protein
MLCREIMSKDVQTCHPTDSALHCAEIMLENDVGFVPVIDARGKPVGVVTDRDLALRVLAAKRPPSTALRHIMSTDVVSCRVLDSIETAEAQLARTQKSRVVVIDEEGRVAGVLSLSDVSQADSAERSGELLESITRREAPTRV